MKTKVITYQNDNGQTVNLTLKQIEILEDAGKWPKDSRGREYCQVSHGLHYGAPTCDTDILSDLLQIG